VFSLNSSFAFADTCTETYECEQTCTKSVRYKTKCGLFHWFRCTRYR